MSLTSCPSRRSSTRRARRSSARCPASGSPASWTSGRASGSRSRSTASPPTRLLAEVRKMAETLLSNPVIEDYEVHGWIDVRIGVVTFPGSLDDDDARRAVRIGGHEAVALWHGDHDLQGVDAVILPGGFSYGDYLRCGAISRFAPVMTEVVAAAEQGLPVLGICNGFQILCESHLLPGALIRNDHRKFVCRTSGCGSRTPAPPGRRRYDDGAEITIVLKNGEGGYVADGRHPRPARGRGPGRRPLPRRQPQRLAARHRRHHQRARQRRRPDAAPRARGRGTLPAPVPTGSASSPRSESAATAAEPNRAQSSGSCADSEDARRAASRRRSGPSPR